jgi:hypothetical protein
VLEVSHPCDPEFQVEDQCEEDQEPSHGCATFVGGIVGAGVGKTAGAVDREQKCNDILGLSESQKKS